MNIIFIHRNLPSDSYTGVAIQVHRLANALVQLGHNVSICSETKTPIDARYHVLPLDYKGLRFVLWMAPFLKRLWYPLWYRKLPFHKYDVVHIHGDGGFIKYAGNYIRTFYGTAALEYKNATSLKGKLAQGFSYALEKKEAKKCRLTVGISPHVAAHLKGVDRIIPCMLADIPLEYFPEKTGEPSLLFMGSFRSRKRGDQALRIFQELSQVIPNLSLTFIGPEKEIKPFREFPQFSRVDFKSKVSQEELNRIYRKSWIYFSLSSYEGFGVSSIEAMANYCMVISIPHPGSEFILRNGETGILVPIESMTKTMIQLIQDDNARKEIAKRAHHFSKKFSPITIALNYLEIYQIACARKTESSV